MHKQGRFIGLLILLFLLLKFPAALAVGPLPLPANACLLLENTVFVGEEKVLYIDADGTVQQVSRDSFFGDSSAMESAVYAEKIAGDRKHLLYLSSGKLYAINGKQQSEQLSDGGTIVQIANAEGNFFALTGDGEVSVLAGSINPEAYQDCASWQEIVSISTGRDFLVGLRKDGSVAVCGDPAYLNLNRIRKWQNVVQLQASNYQVIALSADGKVLFEGGYWKPGKAELFEYEMPESLPDFSEWTDVVQVTSGNNFMAGLRSDGTIVVDGWYDYYHTEYGIDRATQWKEILYIEADWDSLAAITCSGELLVTPQAYFGEPQQRFVKIP